MGLTLVNPAALLGLLAVGVPVLIHLMRKREQVKVLFTENNRNELHPIRAALKAISKLTLGGGGTLGEDHRRHRHRRRRFAEHGPRR